MLKIKNPVRINDARSSILNFGGGKLLLIKLLLLILDNLVNSLARKFKHICNCTERFTTSVHFDNQNISTFVHSWARAQRPPLPIWNHFKHFDAVFAQLFFLVPLTHITNPCAQRDFMSVDELNKNSRDSTVPFASSEISQTFKCQFETCKVVHAGNNSKQMFVGA